jgi:hypothetical protein
MDRRRHEPDLVDERDVDLPEADNDVQTEGDYRAPRQFQWEEHAFSADEHRVKQVVRQAANTPDGEEPAKPRKTAGKGRGR